MILNEKEIIIPKITNRDNLLKNIETETLEALKKDEIPIRFVITETTNNEYKCELGVLSNYEDYNVLENNFIFNFQKRNHENINQFNAVLLIPTGIGAEIGGHSGDGGPVARLIASACDNLITHPNVVNAADINELPENGLYIEGSIITRLLMGTIGLQKVRSNRTLVIIHANEDNFIHDATINSISAARAALGMDCPFVVKMEDNNSILMRSLYSKSGRASGRIEHLERLVDILKKHQSEYDAVALSSIIKVPFHYHEDYFKKTEINMINPWGGVEAMLTHTISSLFNIPSAHSPMVESKEVLNINVEVVDPRKSAEAISTTYLHCILKGLYKSPKIISNAEDINNSNLISAKDISCLIIPENCLGLPTLAALEQDIPVIAVKENKNVMKNNLEELPFASNKLIIVENYLEAVGVMNALKSGVTLESVRRPLEYTKVIEERDNSQNQRMIIEKSNKISQY